MVSPSGMGPVPKPYHTDRTRGQIKHTYTHTAMLGPRHPIHPFRRKRSMLWRRPRGGTHTHTHRHTDRSECLTEHTTALECGLDLSLSLCAKKSVFLKRATAGWNCLFVFFLFFRSEDCCRLGACVCRSLDPGWKVLHGVGADGCDTPHEPDRATYLRTGRVAVEVLVATTRWQR